MSNLQVEYPMPIMFGESSTDDWPKDTSHCPHERNN